MNPDDPQFQQWVEGIDLFKGLRPSDVYKIYSKGMTISLKKGEIIFRKGTTGNSMYVLFGGAMGVYDGEKQLARIQTGESFGEMSLLSGEVRSATVQALEDSRLFMLDEDIFHKLLSKKVAVQILLNLGNMLGKRVRNNNMLIRELEGR